MNHKLPTTLQACRICGGATDHSLVAREMMYGSREEFLYHQCAACGCLQIDSIPSDIARHYPADYYSYNLKRHGWFKRWRRGTRRKLILAAPDSFVRLFTTSSGSDELFHAYRRLGVRLDSQVLDVGAGNGAHVLELREAGIVGALGLDPFIPGDQVWRDAILVRKAALAEIKGQFDLITFHHSLEHMPEQIEILAHAKRLLAPDGKILVRVPTVSSEAFEIYRENWVQLDAPRHYYLHSHQSIKVAALKAGLIVTSLWCDSSPMQFMASEQYQRNIPLFDSRSIVSGKHNSIFNTAEQAVFEQQTRAANSALRGDQICVVMQAASDPVAST